MCCCFSFLKVINLWDEEDPLEMPVLKEALIPIAHSAQKYFALHSFVLLILLPVKRCNKYVFPKLLKYLSVQT